MATVIRVKATVQPGGRVEVTDPALPVGQPVEVVVTVPQTAPPFNILEFLDSLPPSTRTPEEWAERERQIQEEKDAWER